MALVSESPVRDAEGFLPLEHLRAAARASGVEPFVTAFPHPVLLPVSVRGNPAPPAHELTPSTGRKIISFQKTLAASEASARMEAPSALMASYERRVAVLAKRPRNLFPHMISVGRAMNSDVVYVIDTVSKFHGYFVLQAGGWSFTDQRSANGTTINGETLEPGVSRALKDGDKITFGVTVETRFLLPESLHAVLAAP